MLQIPCRLRSGLFCCTSTSYHSAMGWIVSFKKSCVEDLTFHVAEFGARAFRKVIKGEVINEVMWAGPWSTGIGVLISVRDPVENRDLSHACTQRKDHVRSQGESSHVQVRKSSPQKPSLTAGWSCTWEMKVLLFKPPCPWYFIIAEQYTWSPQKHW